MDWSNDTLIESILDETVAGFANAAAIARKADGNPEGKGANGFLLDWYATAPRGVVGKPERQVLAELFTSMLVLSASFKYRPAPGCPNFLYWIDGEWSLSLIEPGQWSAGRRAGFVGTCVLQPDMTWTITPSTQLADSAPLQEAIRQFYRGFAGMLNTDLPLEDLLPFHVTLCRTASPGNGTQSAWSNP